MAELLVDGGELVLHLSATEKVGAVHGDLRVPLSSVRRVEVLADAHEPADHGIKMGTRIPGLMEVGTVRGGGPNILDRRLHRPGSTARQIAPAPVPPA
jgi:hypothetical protein